MSLRVRCFAKINTVLRVLGRRADGYHDLDTEFVSIALADELEMSRADEGFALDVAGAPAFEVPVADNLVLKAAGLLREHAGPARVPGARFRLTKNVPAAAGLGGGSADAAGALDGLDRLFALGTPRRELEEIAMRVGSDVPYFLRGGRQRGRGRGEILDALPDREDQPLLLLKPRVPLSTAAVFRLHAELTASGQPPNDPIAVLTTRKTGSNVALTTWWNEPDVVVHDDLAGAAVRLVPAIAEIAAAAGSLFPEGIVGMTGSGPTVFVLLPRGTDAAGRLGGLPKDADAWLTRTITAAEYRASRFA